MDIMMFLCKGLHVVALSFITILFLYKLHSNKPTEDDSTFSVHLHRDVVNKSSNVVNSKL